MENNKRIMKRGRAWLIVPLLFIVARISSCSATKTAPYAEVVEMPSEDLQKGRELFSNHCASCHPEAMSGVGLAIINKPLPEFLIRFQIRNGIGLMPAFDEKALSDAQVENIAEYLVYLRKENKKK